MRAPLSPTQTEDSLRLKAIMKEWQRENKLTQEQIGERMGMSQGGVWQYANGRIPLNLEVLIKFASLFGCDPREISPSLAGDYLSAIKPSAWQADSMTISDEMRINEFDTGGAMGVGLDLKDQPGIIKSWNVTPEWLRKNVRDYSAKNNLCIVTGFGDSMRPMFNPGDPLLVDAGVKTVEFDAVYFFRIANEGYVKRLQRIPTDNGLVLRAKSENREYDSWEISETMDFAVLGRVLKVWRSEDF